MANITTDIPTDIVHKEIDLIQNCISRMAQNSFMLKGCVVTLVTGVLAFGEKANHEGFLCAVLLIPLLTFWYLDAFFLRTEQLYRKLYEQVLEKRRTGDDSGLYDLNTAHLPDAIKREVKSQVRIMFSKTLWLFYEIPVLIVIGIITHPVWWNWILKCLTLCSCSPIK
ncbi:hypothetical protein FACS1894108_14940 [Planctomycetales bacterium]|nr:hypothetical protein FACS1894108_14940 [Planctomycetales bacterium]